MSLRDLTNEKVGRNFLHGFEDLTHFYEKKQNNLKA